MTQGQSTWWIKYSDYCCTTDPDGTVYIQPAPQAIPMAYDVLAAPGKNIEDLVAIVHADEEMRNLQFARRFGLLGLALENGAPAADQSVAAQSVFRCTGRSPEYSALFSPQYREKAANLSAWLDWLDVVYNRSLRSGTRAEQEPFAPLTLQTMLESMFKEMLEKKFLHCCANCGRIYYNRDTASRTCSEKCRRADADLQYYRQRKQIVRDESRKSK